MQFYRFYSNFVVINKILCAIFRLSGCLTTLAYIACLCCFWLWVVIMCLLFYLCYSDDLPMLHIMYVVCMSCYEKCYPEKYHFKADINVIILGKNVAPYWKLEVERTDQLMFQICLRQPFILLYSKLLLVMVFSEQ